MVTGRFEGKGLPFAFLACKLQIMIFSCVLSNWNLWEENPKHRTWQRGIIKKASFLVFTVAIVIAIGLKPHMASAWDLLLTLCSGIFPGITQGDYVMWL